MEEREVRCPRCDYDLVGEVSRWNHEEGEEGACCPWAGVCSECGLEFVWADLYRPELMRRWWFYENRKGIALGAVVGTLWRAAYVLPLWRAMRLENEVRLARAMVWVEVTVGGAILGVAGAMVLVGLAHRASLLQSLEDCGSVVLAVLDGSGTRDLPTWMKCVGPGFVMCPLVFLVLPFARAQSKVALRHVARGAAYSVAGVVAASAVGVVMSVVGVVIALPSTMRGRWREPDVSFMLKFSGFNPLGGLFDMQAGRGSWRNTFDPGGWLMLLLMGAWLGAYWLVALRTGFRMKDWLAVWASMMACWVVLAVLLLMFDESFLRGVW
jgi:hypothetical protein